MHDLRLYAKTDPKITLHDHLLQTLTIAKKITEGDKNKGHKEDRLILSALIASALHDIGKADKPFQDYLLKRTGKPTPHPLMAMPIVDSVIDEDILPRYYRCIILLAIASHHTPLRSDLYQGKHGLSLNIQHRDELLYILESLAMELNVALNTARLDLTIKPTKVLTQSKYYLLNNNEIDRCKLREDLIYVQGVLEQSDWLASAGKNLMQISFPQNLVARDYDYQEKASLIKGNIFITLPTGSGKTETALYWARNNYGNGDASRVLYVLPTTTTINAMYLRLQRYFGDVVGEYHSNVDIFLDIEKGDSVSDDELLMYKYFFMPVNVTTPDQLLLALMNYKKFTLKSFSMYKSLIIFDEIHAYDAETFAMIRFLLEYLYRHYNTRFCIMSATFPTVMKNELKFLNASDLIPHTDVKRYYESRRRTKIEYKDNLLKDSLDDVVEYLRDGSKVLIVMNTVKRAQEIYRRLKNEVKIEDSLLIHSRYTLNDRHKREKRLNTDRERLPSLLVATQVVEVSLDIDYDVLFTEACYIDSLVQRAGRVNRRGYKREPAPVYIFKPENNHPYEPKLLDSAVEIVIHHMDKVRSEWDYVELTDRFYSMVWNEVWVGHEDRFHRVWDKLQHIYSVDLNDREVAELLKTRSGMVSIPAFPIDLHYRIKELYERRNTTDNVKEKERLSREIRRYLVNVPLLKGITFTTESIGIFVNKGYNNEYGLIDEMDNMI